MPDSVFQSVSQWLFSCFLTSWDMYHIYSRLLTSNTGFVLAVLEWWWAVGMCWWMPFCAVVTAPYILMQDNFLWGEKELIKNVFIQVSSLLLNWSLLMYFSTWLCIKDMWVKTGLCESENRAIWESWSMLRFVKCIFICWGLGTCGPEE